MRDLVEASGHHEYALNFHYAAGARPMVEKDDRWVGDKNHRLFTFGDNGTWQQKESWISNHHGKRVNAPFLRFISHGEGQQEFFTFILPVERAIDPPMIEEVPIVIGRAFIIKYSGYTDVFVYNDEPGQSIDNGIFVSNFEYTWARLRPDETLPDEFVLIGGSRLSIGGKEIFSSHEVSSASALRFGSELYLKTDLGRSVKQL